jgi:hypothetical protein
MRAGKTMFIMIHRNSDTRLWHPHRSSGGTSTTSKVQNSSMTHAATGKKGAPCPSGQIRRYLDRARDNFAVFFAFHFPQKYRVQRTLSHGWLDDRWIETVECNRLAVEGLKGQIGPPS